MADVYLLSWPNVMPKMYIDSHKEEGKMSNRSECVRQFSESEYFNSDTAFSEPGLRALNCSLMAFWYNK